MAKHLLGTTRNVLVAQGEKWEMDSIPLSDKEEMGKGVGGIDLFPGDLGPGNCKHKAWFSS